MIWPRCERKKKASIMKLSLYHKRKKLQQEAVITSNVSEMSFSGTWWCWILALFLFCVLQIELSLWPQLRKHTYLWSDSRMLSHYGSLCYWPWYLMFCLILIGRAEEMAQNLRASNFTNIGNSGSRTSEALFWFLWEPANMWMCAYRHTGKTLLHTI